MTEKNAPSSFESLSIQFAKPMLKALLDKKDPQLWIIYGRDEKVIAELPCDKKEIAERIVHTFNIYDDLKQPLEDFVKKIVLQAH